MPYLLSVRALPDYENWHLEMCFKILKLSSFQRFMPMVPLMQIADQVADHWQIYCNCCGKRACKEQYVWCQVWCIVLETRRQKLHIVPKLKSYTSKCTCLSGMLWKGTHSIIHLEKKDWSKMLLLWVEKSLRVEKKDTTKCQIPILPPPTLKWHQIRFSNLWGIAVWLNHPFWVEKCCGYLNWYALIFVAVPKQTL